LRGHAIMPHPVFERMIDELFSQSLGIILVSAA
jgi:hypothetical protein